MIPGLSTSAEKLTPKRKHHGVKITKTPESTKNPKEDDAEINRKIRNFVDSILKGNVPDAGKDVPTSSTQKAATISSSSEEELAEEKNQETEETTAQ